MPMPPTMPPMHWLRGEPRVDDAARAVGADRAPHPDGAEIGIDRDLGEHRAEGVHREALPPRRRRRWRLPPRSAAPSPSATMLGVGLARRSVVAACAAARRAHSSAIACSRRRRAERSSEIARRTASSRAARQAARTAEPTEAMVMEPPCGGVGGKSDRPSWKRTWLGGEPERLGRHLGHRGVGARAPCRSPPSRPPPCRRAAGGRGRSPARGTRDRSPWPCPSRSADGHRASSAGADRGVPSRSARRRARSTAISERLENGRFSPSSIAGSLRRRSSIGSMPSSYGELVHRALQREDAARLAGPAHVGRRAAVERRQPVARAHVGAGVEIGRDGRQRLDELLVAARSRRCPRGSGR